MGGIAPLDGAAGGGLEEREPDQAFQRRPAAFAGVPWSTWRDWRFQQRNTLRRASSLRSVYPHIPSELVRRAEVWEARGFRFQLTPYLQALIERDEQGVPLPTDPITRQYLPVFDELASEPVPLRLRRKDEYVPSEENWEVDAEMLTPIAQHKYDSRVIVYATDSCLAYCTYCLRSLQSTAQEENHGGVRRHWAATLDAIRARPGVEEVILSGGDPLLLDNSELDRMLGELRAIPHIRTLRVHSRAFSQNPYRIDDELATVLARHEVTAMAVHVIHPRELTPELRATVRRIRRAGAPTLFLAQIPLVKGVNDDVATLRRLFLDLYAAGIKPYYLLHAMPNIPAAAAQRTSVRRGIELLRAIGRTIAHPAFPEFIILHRGGKKTVPLELDGTPEFRFEHDDDGHPIIRLLGWKGTWETYLDGTD